MPMEQDLRETSSTAERWCQQALKVLARDERCHAMADEYRTFLTQHAARPTLTIAFVGQYNAGKSTIIRALTGDKTIKIDSDVTTVGVTEHRWGEWLLVDTPGVSAGRPECDSLTMNAIAGADLLVFVITNELFNEVAAALFKTLVNRAASMVLVVNKMNREPGQTDELLRSIEIVIEPAHPADFSTCFIDADTYLRSQEGPAGDESKQLANESNFAALMGALSQLADQKGLISRLLTPVRKGTDLLEQAKFHLSSGDERIKDLAELYRRKVSILRASRARLTWEIKALVFDLKHKTIMAGEKVASKVNGADKQEDIDAAAKGAASECEKTYAGCIIRLQRTVEDEMHRLQNDLELLHNSPLGRKLAEELSINPLPVTAPAVDGQAVSQKDIPSILRAAPDLLGRIGVLTSKVSKDIVYNTAKFLGTKFKPWGATKATQFIKTLGPIVAGIGAALDIYFAIRDEQEKKKAEEQLRDCRFQIRSCFRETGDQAQTEIDAEVSSAIEPFYGGEINGAEAERGKIEEALGQKASCVKEVDVLLQQGYLLLEGSASLKAD
ncbi:50S ribosome-binding GTPase [Candidatus Bathyarchaeota archaeon]|nr:50S ribosome-binding GTPase [Candidatus Bathyarchaeota archaeon]